MTYDSLLRETNQQGIYIYERQMKPTIKGLYADNVICINSNISTQVEKTCILAEELGHHHTSVGDITDQRKLDNRRQELRARQWAHQRLIPLQSIVDAYKARTKGRHEIADYLNVTEEFLQSAIDRYQEKYGLYAIVDDRYAVCFDPLGVIEMFGE